MNPSILSLSLFFIAGGMASAQASNPTVASLSFEDIRAACQDPSRFHNQVAPANIRVSCRDAQNRWVPHAGRDIALQGSRQVTTSVISDKYSSTAVTGSMDSAGNLAACPRFKLVAETIETVRAVSCEELIAFSGGALEFCAGSLDSLRQNNPAAVVVADGGQILDLCGAGNPTSTGQQY
jgi:hypothetical protein